MDGPIVNDCVASVLNRVAQGPSRPAYNGVSFLVEDFNFVPSEQIPLAAFMIEDNHIIGLFLLVIDDDLLATFTKRLNDFRSLRSGATLRAAGEGST